MGSRTGRPRSFDKATALEQATLLFWRHGYDAVSIRDLTDAMGIAPASLYAAFTDKQTLFEQAVDAYAHKHGSYIAAAIDEEPTAYQAVRRLLTQSAIQQTRPGFPPGCLILNCASNHAATSEHVAAALRDRRAETASMIEHKVQADIDRGQLPADINPHQLTNYTVAVWQGLSQLARDGRTTQELQEVVETAMVAWPQTNPSTQTSGAAGTAPKPSQRPQTHTASRSPSETSHDGMS